MMYSEITILGLYFKGSELCIYLCILYLVRGNLHVDLCNSMFNCNAFDGFFVTC